MEGSPAPASGVKRKRNPETKFYAVHRGSTPGIYYDWKECKSQIDGFKGALYKSFSTLTDAQDFLENGLSARTSSRGPQKFYGVASGKVPGVYTHWDDAQAQLVGGTKPRYKAFSTRAEAEEFVKNVAQGTDVSGPGRKKKKGRDSEGPGQENRVYGPGDGDLPADAEDGFDSSIALDSSTGKIEYKSDRQLNKTKSQASGMADDGELRIWTDGSSRGNGTANAVAGVGVYFGPGDSRNIAEPLQGPRQTNQRAELTAILRALELSPRDRPVTILSDSSYAINCVTTWFTKWRSNGWQNASKKPVENRDIIEKILGFLEERERISDLYSTENGDGENGAKAEDAEDVVEEDAKRKSWKKGRARVKFQWVKGHAGEDGNNEADLLAVAGAKKAKEGT